MMWIQFDVSSILADRFMKVQSDALVVVG